MSTLSNIEIQGVSKRYKSAEQNSLTSVNLDFQAGDIIGILGPNGAGKTTLISIICGLLDPTEGQVQFNGIDPATIRQHIGYVPQDFALYEDLTACQNLQFFGTLYNVPKSELTSRINELLEDVGLTEFQNKKVGTYSGGMKRRLNLALGLLHHPTIVFLDEPTVGVDVQSRRSILNHLKELNQKGVTIIYTSHHLSEAQEFCDVIALLDHGKVLEFGRTSELLESRSHQHLEDYFLEITGEQLRDAHA